MVDGLGGLVGAVASGAMDASGISTNAAYDVLKGISQKALARVMEPAVRDKILSQTVTNMEADGMGAEQAAYLAGLVRDKRHLERGAKEDPMALIRLVQTEVLAVGHSKEESSALLTALSRAVALHTSAEPAQAIAGAQTLLNTEKLKVGQDEIKASQDELRLMMTQMMETARQDPVQLVLAQVLENTRPTPRKNVEDLAALMRRAGQDRAELALRPDGGVRIQGTVTLRVQATGATAVALKEAATALDRGEGFKVLRRSEDALIVTTGDTDLDDLLHIRGSASSLEFAPTPRPYPIIIRPRNGVEVRLTATLMYVGGESPHLRLALSEGEHRTVVMRVEEDMVWWRPELDFKRRPVTEEDRPLLLALEAFEKPGTKIYEAETHDLFVIVSESNDTLVENAQLARGWRYVLNLFAYLREELPDVTFTSIDPEGLSPYSATLLRHLLGHVSGELEGEFMTLEQPYQLTADNIETFTTGGTKTFSIPHDLELPGWTPLRLTTLADCDTYFCRVAGRRIKRGKLNSYIGQVVDVYVRGKIRSTTLTAVPDEEA